MSISTISIILIIILVAVIFYLIVKAKKNTVKIHKPYEAITDEKDAESKGYVKRPDIKTSGHSKDLMKPIKEEASEMPKKRPTGSRSRTKPKAKTTTAKKKK